MLNKILTRKFKYTASFTSEKKQCCLLTLATSINKIEFARTWRLLLEKLWGRKSRMMLAKELEKIHGTIKNIV